jgi:YceI-like domain
VAIETGTYSLGSDSATLTVKTGRAGAIAKIGHDLVMEVGSWEATLDVGGDDGEASIVLTADARSLRVVEGTGGIQALGSEEKAGIEQTIDDEVLKGTTIAFRSRSVRLDPGGAALHVDGELELAGRRHGIAFVLTAGEDGRLTGSATLRQTNWGLRPYSALFGTLKVADDVEVALDARLPSLANSRRDDRG